MIVPHLGHLQRLLSGSSLRLKVVAHFGQVNRKRLVLMGQLQSSKRVITVRVIKYSSEYSLAIKEKQALLLPIWTGGPARPAGSVDLDV
jgi:hypothetical protein